MRNLRWLVASAACLGSFACLSPPVSSVKTRVVQQTPIRVPQNDMSQVDILFLVDNSPSMEAMQAELKSKFGQFFTVFEALARGGTYADLHIGVVTSDYGAGSHDNRSTGSDGITRGCDQSPGGQRGLLQTTAAAHEPNAGCAGPVGAPFLHYAFGPSGASGNLPAGQSLVDTFTCMASVGAHGCGFEHQLESVYAALTNTKENAGFLRDGALLTVVFVTNEDDGSAPPGSMIYESDATSAKMYGAYDTYRQTRWGVACGSPLALAPYAVAGPLDGCVPAENDDKVRLGQEYDVSRYADFLLGTHAVKPDAPNNVILVGIVAPETPFEVIEADLSTGAGSAPHPTYGPCAPGAMVGSTSCSYRLQHSCQNRVAPGFFGDPAVRLDSVIGKAKLSGISSICGDDLGQTPDYSRALQAVANLIKNAIAPGCIPAPLTNLADPDCVVEDVTSDGNGTITGESELPRCTLDGNGAPLPSNAFPCWAVQHKEQCRDKSPDGVGVTIFRNGVAAPPRTTARVECSTLAGAPM